MTGLKNLAAAFVGALALVSLQAQAADFNLRLHTLVKSPHPYNDMADFMKAELEAKSDGPIAVTIFDSGQLGQDPAVIGEMGLGTIDLMISSTSNAVKQVPEYQVFSIPYAFADFDDLMAKVAPGTPAEAYFRKVYEERGLNMRLLALGGSGTRNMANALRPVDGLADIQGLKMRTPPSQIMAKTWQALGTVPVTIAWGELYAGVQTGVAQGLESSLPGYTGSKLYEVAPYLALTGHEIQVNHISISQRAWDRLPADLQELMQSVAAAAIQHGAAKAKQYDAELLDELVKDHGVTVTQPDIAEFRAALTSVQGDLAQELGLAAALESLR